MTADRFWELLSKKVSAEATDAEIKELENIQEKNPDWKHYGEIVTSLWHQPDPFYNIESNEAFEKHIEKLNSSGLEWESPTASKENIASSKTSGSKKLLFIATAMAASLAVFFFVKNLFDHGGSKNQTAVSQVITKAGSRTQIQLPDGSVVWLNSSSSLIPDENFGKNLREVTLTGEAFFKVMKDPSHPFVIHTKTIDVKVLGTEFNIKAYPDDSNTETSLIKGSVEVTIKNRQNEKLFLVPNEKIVVANAPAQVAELKKEQSNKPLIFSIQHLNYYPTDSVITETAWVDNMLRFQENESFKEVALKMERWYGVTIEFTDENIEKYRLYGSFTNETITQALDRLSLAFNFTYKMKGNIITISP